MPSHSRARKAALKKLDKQIAKSKSLINAALDRYSPPKLIWDILHGATLAPSVCGYLALSNLFLRRYAAQVLMCLLLNQYDQNRGDSDVHTFLMTAAFDAGFSFEDGPIVDLASMSLSVRRVLKRLNMQAVCIFEVDVLAKKLDGENSRRLMFHVHAICWTSDNTFQPVKAGRELSGSRYFTNMLGAPSFTFVSRRMAASRRINCDTEPRFTNLDRDQNAHSIAWLVQYMLKPPLYAKNRIPLDDGSFIMRADAGAFRLKTVLRLSEVWSKISINEATFAVGRDADKLVRAFKRKVADHAQTSSFRASELDEHGIAQAWKRFFEKHHKLGLRSSIIKHRTS